MMSAVMFKYCFIPGAQGFPRPCASPWCVLMNFPCSSLLYDHVFWHHRILFRSWSWPLTLSYWSLFSDTYRQDLLPWTLLYLQHYVYASMKAETPLHISNTFKKAKSSFSPQLSYTIFLPYFHFPQERCNLVISFLKSKIFLCSELVNFLFRPLPIL